MSKSGRESLPDVREWSGVVGRPSQMSVSGREAIPDGLECSGGRAGCPGVSGSGR